MVLIIGCGYVGEHIGLALKNQNVVVTAKTPSSVERLKAHFQNVEQLDTSDQHKLDQLIQKHDTIIITLAAPDAYSYEKTYLNTAKNIASTLERSPHVKQLIYTSSTSVYGEHHGNAVDEDSPLLAHSHQGKILIETEKTYLSLSTPNRHVCIFRLGEIYGCGREIELKVKAYQHKKAPGDGLNTTNMTHVEDITQAALFAMENNLQGIFNLVDDDHMTRYDLYQKVCQLHGLPNVEWDPNLQTPHSSKKIVLNDKIKKKGYCFRFPKRMI